MLLYLINILAAVFILIGFHVAFRQRLVRAWGARLRQSVSQSDSARPTETTLDDNQEIASVLRIAGVMVMAFSFTGAAFANLIAYYTAASAG